MVRCFPTVFYLSNPFTPCIYQFRTVLLLLLRKGLSKRSSIFTSTEARKQSREEMWGRKVASESQSVIQTAVDLSIASQLRIWPKLSKLSEVNSVIQESCQFFYLIKNILNQYRNYNYKKIYMNHQSLGPIICYSQLFILFVWWPC